MLISNLSITATSEELYEVVIGETWRITCSFDYVTTEPSTVILRACPYQWQQAFGVGVKDEIGECAGTTEIYLPEGSGTKEESVDIYFKPKSDNGIDDGVYGLKVEIVETEEEVFQENTFRVTGNPMGVLDLLGLLPMLMMVMVMSMVMQNMPQITETVKREAPKLAKKVGKAALEAVEKEYQLRLKGTIV